MFGNRFFCATNLQHFLTVKHRLNQTFLSPFTIVENNVVGLTTDHLVNKANKRIIGRQRKEVMPMVELLKQTNWQVMSVQNDLKRIVDNGEFHTHLWINQTVDATIYPKISKCFVLELREFENPLIIKIRYPNQRVR